MDDAPDATSPRGPAVLGAQGQGSASEVGWRLRWPALAASVSADPPEGAGLYFLIRAVQIVYVGSSLFPSKRVWSHAQDPEKHFDDSVFLAVDEDQLLKTERHWIRTLCPVHNKAFNPKPDSGFPGWGGDPTYFLLRLPIEYWYMLRAITKKTARTMTIEAQIAIEIRARELGIDFKAKYPPNL